MNVRPGVSRRSFLRSSAALVAGLGGAALAAEPAAVPTVDEWIKKQAADAPLLMRFNGDTAEDCRRWQALFAAKLRELLGDFAPPPKWRTVRERTAELDDHRRDELVLLADDVPPLPLYVLT